MNFCHQCGASLAEGMRFCGECGTPIDENPVSTAETHNGRSNSDDDNQPVIQSAGQELCTFCATPIEPQAHFCISCGRPAAERVIKAEATVDRPVGTGAEGLFAGLMGTSCGCGCLVPIVLLSLLVFIGFLGLLL